MDRVAKQLRTSHVWHEARSFGYVIHGMGYIDPAEAARASRELKRLVMKEGRPTFGLLFDLRRQPVQPPGTTAIAQEMMHWTTAHGAHRTAVVGDSAVQLLQAKRMAAECGIEKGVRYLDVRHTVDWERAAIAWIEHGVEPGADDGP
jgi:hypothetical protein